jgi:hypothetical protein
VAGSGDEAAQQVIADVLADATPGDQAGAQTQGQIDNPHGHTDSWSGTKQADGSIKFNKEHT